MQLLKRGFYRYVGKRLYAKHGEFLPDKPSPLEVPRRWIEPHKLARIKFGLYEKNEVALTRRYLDPDLDTVELGSGIGIVSSAICRLLSAERRFVGVEGNPELVEVARRNVSRFQGNGCRDVVHAVISGKVSSSGGREFQMTERNFHHSSYGSHSAATVSIHVPEVTLTGLLGTFRYGEFQLVSDVEGGELEILEKDPGSLENCRQIIAELHECTREDGSRVSIDDLVEMVKQLDYRLLERRNQVYVFRRN